LTNVAFTNITYRRLGLAIPDGAIDEMKARVEVTDEDLKVVAAEGSSINFFSIKDSTKPRVGISPRLESGLERCLLWNWDSGYEPNLRVRISSRPQPMLVSYYYASQHLIRFLRSLTSIKAD
jgi:hypothetical protein